MTHSHPLSSRPAFSLSLRQAWARSASLLCVGLDPDPQRFPAHLAGRPDAVLRFCTEIVDATADLVCAFKPQAAYFAAQRAEEQLEALIAHIHSRHPGVPVILDVKRGDIGSTAELAGQTLELSARETGLLEILLQRAGRLVSKEQIVDHLCEWGDEVSTNAIEVYMHRLRKKLEGGGIRIVTVRGLGYCLEKPVETALAEPATSTAASRPPPAAGPDGPEA